MCILSQSCIITLDRPDFLPQRLLSSRGMSGRKSLNLHDGKTASIQAVCLNPPSCTNLMDWVIFRGYAGQALYREKEVILIQPAVRGGGSRIFDSVWEAESHEPKGYVSYVE